MFELIILAFLNIGPLIILRSIDVKVLRVHQIIEYFIVLLQISIMKTL